MKKLLLMSFILTFTILLGVTSAWDGRDKTDYAEQARIEERLKAEQERQAALRTLTLPYQVPGGMTLSQPENLVAPPTITEIDCAVPPGIAENEPECGPDYDDIYNSGCNSSTAPGVIPTLPAADGDVYCGESGVFPSGTSTYRDTDWYRVVLTQPSDLSVTVTAEFPLQILMIDAGSEDCVDYVIEESDVEETPETPLTVSLRRWVETGETVVYWVWIGPSVWDLNIQCDGLGTYGDEYQAEFHVTPTPPAQVNYDIGPLNTPFADLGNTTCGAGHDYDGPDCNGIYWNSGEDFVYKFTVSSTIVLDIVLDPDTTAWTSLLFDDFCPPDPVTCLGRATNSTASPFGFSQMLVQPGTYFLYVDKWSPTDCIANYDLYIVEGTVTTSLGVTDNMPDCGVSNFGPLGETDAQGNTYGWGGYDPVNFAGTLVMGNSPTTMFAYYNPGITDCYEYRGITGVDIIDPYHPTSRFDDNDVLGGLTVHYAGFGYSTGGNADNIFVHAFKFKNTSGSTISDFYAGTYFDWDIDTDGGDTVIFDWANNMIVQTPLAETLFAGLCLVNDGSANLNSMTAVSQQDHIYPTGPSGGGWLMSELYTLMSTPGDSIADSMYSDMSSLLSTGPYTIPDGDSAVMIIAVIGAASLADLQTYAQVADTLTIPDFSVDPPPPPNGRCCYVSGVDTLCVDNLEGECTTLGGYDWNRYLNCADFPCVESGCDYVVGDVNGSNNYNGLDVTYGVNFFKYGSPSPQCTDCPLCPGWFYCGDVNGSCNYNGLDVTYSVNYFKYGSPAPVPCGDCPPIG